MTRAEPTPVKSTFIDGLTDSVEKINKIKVNLK